MKLLRLTTDNQNGTFDGFLNQEIDIPEKSQIALQSAVFETQPETVIIDSSNDQISFQTANATGTQTITLEHTDGQAGSDRQFQIPRAVNTGSFAMAHQKAPNKVTLATEFKVLVPDTTLNVGSSGGSYYLFKVVENRNDSDELDIN